MSELRRGATLKYTLTTRCFPNPMHIPLRTASNYRGTFLLRVAAPPYWLAAPLYAALLGRHTRCDVVHLQGGGIGACLDSHLRRILPIQSLVGRSQSPDRAELYMTKYGVREPSGSLLERCWRNHGCGAVVERLAEGGKTRPSPLGLVQWCHETRPELLRLQLQSLPMTTPPSLARSITIW